MVDMDWKVILKTLRKLPPRSSVLDVEEVRDIWGTLRTALVVVWWDEDWKQIRRGFFDATTGEYLGDY